MDSRPIQALAPGFLGILGLKNNGNLPELCRDSVQPVLDMAPFYNAGRRVSAQFNTNALIAGVVGSIDFTTFTVSPIVPDGRAWLIEQGEIVVTAAAAQVVSTSAALLVAAQTNSSADRLISDHAGWGSPNVAATALVANTEASAPVRNGVLLLPRDFLACHVDWTHGAGTVTSVTVKLTYADFPI